ncbi:MAG TPA: phytanoyl-CoA dioxygenase family protein [Candidatus Dormibacteraeota bacterium]|jgi:ectoine hydroxylase-related dioxygenase (phytanoyl-CoA dioxygenase family)|nr:phytanoyl-CoA dioxygenase family protein [Candidatus Dormibacteraeota bacterium]
MLEEAIERQGFAILPEVLATSAIQRLLEGISVASPRRSRAGMRHALGLSPVAALARQPDVIELARAVLGNLAFPYRATLFDKSPKSNWLVVWHQDTALPLRSQREALGWGPWSVKEGVIYAHAPATVLSRVLALRIHLDHSTARNGPLRVVPATHTLGVLDDDRIHEIATKSAPVECLVPAGGILAMRPLLIHSSSKSREETDRRVLHIEYAASPSITAPLELAIT